MVFTYTMRRKSLKQLLLLCAIGVSLQAAPIGFLFRTDPSTIRSDFNGDGTEETIAQLTTPTYIRMWFDPFPEISLSTADQTRYFRADGITIENMFLDPVRQHLAGSVGVNDQIGFSFTEYVGASANGTHYYGGKRVDQSISLSWYQEYSNDVSTSVERRQMHPWSGPYAATLNERQTLTNLINDTRHTPFYFSFTTVWSNPTTYMYEKHSTWSGNGYIVGLIQPPAAVPEPATAFLIAPAAFGLYMLRRRLVR